ncbi:MAG: glycosyltransferase [Bacteroidetes bacterium]|nr:glycosyltransferase [Bacteroidota bacterium]
MTNQRPLRIVVFSPYCLLRPTTNRIFDMRLCDSFAGHNVPVTIVYPYAYMKGNISAGKIPKSYGLQHTVSTRMLLTPLRETSSKYTFLFWMMIGFGFSTIRLFFSSLFSSHQTILFSRDPKLLVPALWLKKYLGRLFRVKVIFMAAEVKDTRLYKKVVRETDGVFAGVSTTRDAIRKIADVPEEKFILSLAPVPVYKNDPSKTEARKIIQYDSERPLIVYTGKLGLDVLEVIYIFEAARILPEYQFLFTGGRPQVVSDVKAYCNEKGIANVMFTGFFDDSTAVRNFQLAADVLVSYYTSKDHMIEFNYPQKVNEYLSTRNPVVTPDFPATRDVLNEHNVFFVAPDDPKSLAEGIRKAVEDKVTAKQIANQAWEDVQNLSFESRTRELLTFVTLLK